MYDYDRRATSPATPQDTAKALEHALASHFSGHYFEVKAERGVSVRAGRMDEEAFAKKGLIEGYDKVGVNPVAKVIIVPDSGNDWSSLSVRSAAGMSGSDDVLKQVGVQPIRKASKLTPEKALKLVTEWFTKNAGKLKSGGEIKMAYDYDRGAP